MLGVWLDSTIVVSAKNAWVVYPINRYESYQAFSTQWVDMEENIKVNSAEKTVIKKEFMLVTPNGKVKTLKID